MKFFKNNLRIIRALLIFVLAASLSGCIPVNTGMADTTAPESTLQLIEDDEESGGVTLSLTRTPEEERKDKKPLPKDKTDAVKDKKDTQKDKKGKKDKKDKEEAAKTEDEGISPEEKKESITEDGQYHDLESVVLYYDKFGKLPPNFITKKEAKDLGWEGGRLDPFRKGASIGGDYFGNFEKRLPAGKGIKYIECDIDTDGGKRGPKRLIISNDGRYYYTGDHYESFREVLVRDGGVIFAD